MVRITKVRSRTAKAPVAKFKAGAQPAGSGYELPHLVRLTFQRKRFRALCRAILPSYRFMQHESPLLKRPRIRPQWQDSSSRGDLAERALVSQLEPSGTRLLFHCFWPADLARLVSSDNGE